MIDASIIIPTYNRLWSLPEAIASCPRTANIEIIVVDDGSTDGTWDWLQTQPHVRAIRQINWGKPAAANAGLAASRGRYIRFLDSDDLLIAEEVVAQLAAVIEADADISVAGYYAQYDTTGERQLVTWQDCGDFIAQQLGECNSSHYSAYFFRRELMCDVVHRPEYAFRDDRMLVLECALRQPTVVEWPRPSLVHRHHDRPRVQFQPGAVAVVTAWQELQMYRRIAALLDTLGLATPRRYAALTRNVWPVALRMAAFDSIEARRTIEWIYRLDPGFTIPAGRMNRLYGALGFRVANGIVGTARIARDTGRRTMAMLSGWSRPAPQNRRAIEVAKLSAGR